MVDLIVLCGAIALYFALVGMEAERWRSWGGYDPIGAILIALAWPLYTAFDDGPKRSELFRAAELSARMARKARRRR